MTPDPGFKVVPASKELMALVNDLKLTLARHQHLDAEQMLAAVSQLVGNLVALQDQRSMTPEDAIEVVRQNLEEGNRIAMEELLSAGGTMQ